MWFFLTGSVEEREQHVDEVVSELLSAEADLGSPGELGLAHGVARFGVELESQREVGHVVQKGEESGEWNMSDFETPSSYFADYVLLNKVYNTIYQYRVNMILL